MTAERVISESDRSGLQIGEKGIEGEVFLGRSRSQLRKGQRGVRSKALALREKFVLHRYETERGKEYALHGFSRRLDGLAHCVERVFDLPKRNSLVEAASNIQSFIINVSGCCNNSAWVWVFQKNVTLEDGSDLPQHGSPHTVDPSDAAEYVELEDKIYKATLLGDISLVESFELAALMRLSPFMVHSAT